MPSITADNDLAKVALTRQNYLAPGRLFFFLNRKDNRHGDHDRYAAQLRPFALHVAIGSRSNAYRIMVASASPMQWSIRSCDRGSTDDMRPPGRSSELFPAIGFHETEYLIPPRTTNQESGTVDLFCR